MKIEDDLKQWAVSHLKHEVNRAEGTVKLTNTSHRDAPFVVVFRGIRILANRPGVFKEIASLEPGESVTAKIRGTRLSDTFIRIYTRFQLANWPQIDVGIPPSDGQIESALTWHKGFTESKMLNKAEAVLDELPKLGASAKISDIAMVSESLESMRQLWDESNKELGELRFLPVDDRMDLDLDEYFRDCYSRIAAIGDLLKAGDVKRAASEVAAVKKLTDPGESINSKVEKLRSLRS